MSPKKSKRYSMLIALHILLMVYSMSGIFSKLASGEPFLSLKFCLYYGGVIAILGVYALGWQQIVKRLPLTVAFAYWVAVGSMLQYSSFWVMVKDLPNKS